MMMKIIFPFARLLVKIKIGNGDISLPVNYRFSQEAKTLIFNAVQTETRKPGNFQVWWKQTSSHWKMQPGKQQANK